MDKEKLLNDVYKYYTVGEQYYYDLDEEAKNKLLSDKAKLREMKITNKRNRIKEEMDQKLAEVTKNYELVDWYDKEACCYEWSLLLHKNTPILDDDKELLKSLNGSRNDLRIFASILEPYYYMFVEQTTYQEENDTWSFYSFYTKTEYDKEIQKLMDDIDSIYKKMGYQKLSYEEAMLLVPGIETELRDMDKATVFECLFTDLVDLSIISKTVNLNDDL